MHWVIQSNLGRSRDVQALIAACEALGHPHHAVKAIPFSDALPELPSVPRSPVVFYGATSFVASVHRSGRYEPGVFFDSAGFCHEAYEAAFGDRLLNAGALRTTLGALASEDRDPESLLFVRPEADSKAFAGAVLPFAKLVNWIEGLQGDDLELTPECPVIAAVPVGIAQEHRLFVVHEKVVAASRYRSHHELDTAQGAPQEVIDFAEVMARRFSPAEVFVMDVALSGGALYVIELNCFNGAGFYEANISSVVAAVSAIRTAS